MKLLMFNIKLILITFVFFSPARLISQKAGPVFGGWTTVVKLDPAGYSDKYYNLLGKYNYMGSFLESYGVNSEDNIYFNNLKFKIWSFDKEKYTLQEPKDIKFPKEDVIYYSSEIIGDSMYIFVAQKKSVISYKVYATKADKPGKWNSKTLEGYENIDVFRFKNLKRCNILNDICIGEIYGDSLLTRRYSNSGELKVKLSVGNLTGHVLKNIYYSNDYYMAVSEKEGEFFLNVYNDKVAVSRMAFTTENGVTQYDINVINNTAILSALVQDKKNRLMGYAQVNLNIITKEIVTVYHKLNEQLNEASISGVLNVNSLDESDYKLSGTFVDNNNNIHIVASQYKRILQVTGGAAGVGGAMGTPSSAKHKYFNGNIVVFKTNEKGDELWQSIIPKKSLKSNDPGMDYFTYLKGNTLTFLFHDHKKNPKSGIPIKPLKYAIAKKSPLTFTGLDEKEGSYSKSQTVDYVNQKMQFDLVHPFAQENTLMLFGIKSSFPKISPDHQLVNVKL